MLMMASLQQKQHRALSGFRFIQARRSSLCYLFVFSVMILAISILLPERAYAQDVTETGSGAPVITPSMLREQFGDEPEDDLFDFEEDDPLLLDEPEEDQQRLDTLRDTSIQPVSPTPADSTATDMPDVPSPEDAVTEATDIAPQAPRAVPSVPSPPEDSDTTPTQPEVDIPDIPVTADTPVVAPDDTPSAPTETTRIVAPTVIPAMPDADQAYVPPLSHTSQTEAPPPDTSATVQSSMDDDALMDLFMITPADESLTTSMPDQAPHVPSSLNPSPSPAEPDQPSAPVTGRMADAPTELYIDRSGSHPFLSPATLDILQQLPSGLSSIDEEDQQKGPIAIQRGESTEGMFPIEGYQDDSPVGMSISVSDDDKSIETLLDQAYEALIFGQTESAIHIYKNVLLREPEHQLALFGLATSYQRTRQFTQARLVYNRLFSLYPDYPEALNNFLALVAEEAPDEALAEMERLEKRNPHFSPIPAQMGMVHLQVGHFDLAARKLARAVSLSPENLSYRYNLAIAMDKLGDKKEAGRLYKQIIDAVNTGMPPPAPIEAIQERLTFLRANR